MSRKRNCTIKTQNQIKFIVLKYIKTGCIMFDKGDVRQVCDFVFCYLYHFIG